MRHLPTLVVMRTRVGLTKNKWGFGIVAIEVIAKTSGKWDVI